MTKEEKQAKHREYARLYREANRQLLRDKENARRRGPKKEWILTRARECRRHNAQEINRRRRARYPQRRDVSRAKSRQWYLDNIDRVREYRKRNRAAILAYKVAYRLRNIERVHEYGFLYRLRKTLGSVPGGELLDMLREVRNYWLIRRERIRREGA